MKIGSIQFNDYPIFLAPLEDITDPPFRALCKAQGADMVYTEFISSEGLIRDADKSIKKLDINPEERPVGIQIFGNNLESMVKAAQMAADAKPDLIDINWGCPVRKVAMKGAGSGILQNIPAMISITAAVVKSTNLPVTVKTRLGWDENSKPIVEIAEKLQDIGIAAITIHGRTRSQLYSGKADWTLIGKVKENPRMIIPVIGNGDITSPQQVKNAFEQWGVDGVMIGRAAIGYPWLFSEIKSYLIEGFLPDSPSVANRLAMCRKHLSDEIEWKGERPAINEMRKFYSGYFSSIPGIKLFRMKLLSTQSSEAIFEILQEMEEYYSSREDLLFQSPNRNEIT